MPPVRHRKETRMVSPTAVHTRYRNKAGKIVPGVTTVISLLAKPALVGWAWKLGVQGQDMNKVRDMAADIGTCAHYLCECYLKGETPDLQHFTQFILGEGTKLFNAFKDWWERQDIQVIVSEENVVSENWDYGGCIDIVANHYGKVSLLDIKTSKGIYAEYRIQLAAYEQAWNELHPDQPIEKIMVLHLDKEQYTCSVHPFQDLKTEWEIFLHLRQIYILQKQTDPRRDRAQSKGFRKVGRLAAAARGERA